MVEIPARWGLGCGQIARPSRRGASVVAQGGLLLRALSGLVGQQKVTIVGALSLHVRSVCRHSHCEWRLDQIGVSARVLERGGRVLDRVSLGWVSAYDMRPRLAVSLLGKRLVSSRWVGRDWTLPVFVLEGTTQGRAGGTNPRGVLFGVLVLAACLFRGEHRHDVAAIVRDLVGRLLWGICGVLGERLEH